jgi:hypothetical protein
MDWKWDSSHQAIESLLGKLKALSSNPVPPKKKGKERKNEIFI